MSTSLSRLQSFYGELKAPLLLHAVIKREFIGSVALLTACAEDAGLLLSLVAAIDPTTPILCLTPKTNASEISQYRNALATRFNLTRMRWLAPTSDPDSLADVLDEMGILALITARSGGNSRRIALDENGVFRINPFADWQEDARNKELEKLDLPPHPLGVNASTESSALAHLLEAIDVSSVFTVDWHV